MIAYDELVSALALWRESNGLGAVGADYLGSPPPPEPISFAAYDKQPPQSPVEGVAVEGVAVEGVAVEGVQVQDEIDVIRDDYSQGSHRDLENLHESVAENYPENAENYTDPLAEFSDEPTEFGVAPMTIDQGEPPILSDAHANRGADALLDEALFDIPLDVDESAIIEQQDVNTTFNNEDVPVIANPVPVEDPINDGTADLTLDQDAFSAQVSAAHTELASGSIENLPSSLPDSVDGSDTDN